MLNISVFPNPAKDPGLKHTRKLMEFLFEHACQVFVSERCYAEIAKTNPDCLPLFQRDDCRVVSEERVYTGSDLGIVLGGDGTILRVGKKAARTGLLILGVNLGKIGYIAELECNELHLIEELLKLGNISEMARLPGFSVDSRMMLHTEIIRDGGVIYSADALNDAVISKGPISKMIDLSVFCDGRLITGYRADGIIVSSPTGSTAYAMSAGGPIIDPSVECVCVIPVCPYLCVNSSPIIFSGNSHIEVLFHPKKKVEAYLTVDGKGGELLRDQDRVRIQKSNYETKLLRIKNIDFYKLLHKKLSRQIEK